MNNEPVAIVNTNCENNIQWNVLKPQEYNGYFLYTHPVKELDEQFEKGFKAGKEEGWKAHKFHHPVKEQDTECQYCKQGCIRCDARKQLTDEEIKQTFQEQTGFYFDDNPADDLALMDFARAILRKAQEK